MPVASTSPGGRSASAASAIRRVSTWWTAASSGASAFQTFPAGRAGRRAPASRGLSSQAATRADQRSAVGRWVHWSNRSVGSHAGSPSASAAVASRPAAARHLDQQRGGRLVDVQLRGGRAQVAHAQPAVAQGGRRVSPHWSSSSSTRRTASKAAPAAGPVDQRLVALARSPARARRRPARSSCGRRAARPPPRRAAPRRRRRAGRAAGGPSSSSAGVSASSGRTVCRGGPGGRLAAGLQDVLEQRPRRRLTARRGRRRTSPRRGRGRRARPLTQPADRHGSATALSAADAAAGSPTRARGRAAGRGRPRRRRAPRARRRTARVPRGLTHDDEGI